MVCETADHEKSFGIYISQKKSSIDIKHQNLKKYIYFYLRWIQNFIPMKNIKSIYL